MPRGQAQQAAHAEDREVQDPGVGGLVGVPHLLLPLSHVGEVLHNRLAQVLQPLQLNLQRLQFGRVGQTLVRFGLDAVFRL